MVFVFAIFLIQSTANAQTALEQQCFNAVQGKVAYNQAGNKSWDPANINKLCQGTTNPFATISCFQEQIRVHNNWSQGINACGNNPSQPNKINIVPNSKPTNISKPTQPESANPNAGFGLVLGGKGGSSSGVVIPPDCREYDVEIKTGIEDDAESDGDVFVTIKGTTGTTGEINVSNTLSERNNNVPGSCRLNGNPVQYVRYDKKKSVSGSGGSFKTFQKNTSQTVTLNANDVGTISSVTIRHSRGRAYFDYLLIKSPDEYYIPIKHWLTNNDVSQNFHVTTKPKLTEYRLNIKTGDAYLAGTDANVYLTIEGENGITFPKLNLKSLLTGNPLERGKTDTLYLTNFPLLAKPNLRYVSQGREEFAVLGIRKITVTSDLSGADSDWLLDSIEISSPDLCAAKTVIDGKFVPECVKSERFSNYDWLNRDKSSVILTGEPATDTSRTITFRNEGGFMATMVVQYFVDTKISGQTVPMMKTLSTPKMPVGQSSTVEIPKTTANLKIIVFLIGTATTNDNFFTEQIDSGFTGNKCFKAYNTFANPTGAKCN